MPASTPVAGREPAELVLGELAKADRMLEEGNDEADLAASSGCPSRRSPH